MLIWCSQIWFTYNINVAFHNMTTYTRLMKRDIFGFMTYLNCRCWHFEAEWAYMFKSDESSQDSQNQEMCCYWYTVYQTEGKRFLNKIISTLSNVFLLHVSIQYVINTSFCPLTSQLFPSSFCDIHLSPFGSIFTLSILSLWQKVLHVCTLSVLHLWVGLDEWLNVVSVKLRFGVTLPRCRW